MVKDEENEMHDSILAMRDVLILGLTEDGQSVQANHDA